jgi:transposase
MQIGYEELSVGTMHFKARRMNAYLYASNLGHIPKQLAWGARKRGQRARAGPAAYSSQACSRCQFVSRANRADQQTFCSQACGLSAHADENAAINHQARFDDCELRACRSREEVKALLDARHVALMQSTVGRSPTARPVGTSTGVGQHSRARGRKHQRQAS